MLIGLILSAVVGGITGTVWSIGQEHELAQILASYPLGGMAAVLAFVLLTSAGNDLTQRPVFLRQD